MVDKYCGGLLTSKFDIVPEVISFDIKIFCQNCENVEGRKLYATSSTFSQAFPWICEWDKGKDTELYGKLV